MSLNSGSQKQNWVWIQAHRNLQTRFLLGWQFHPNEVQNTYDFRGFPRLFSTRPVLRVFSGSQDAMCFHPCPFYVSYVLNSYLSGTKLRRLRQTTLPFPEKYFQMSQMFVITSKLTPSKLKDLKWTWPLLPKRKLNMEGQDDPIFGVISSPDGLLWLKTIASKEGG